MCRKRRRMFYHWRRHGNGGFRRVNVNEMAAHQHLCWMWGSFPCATCSHTRFSSIRIYIHVQVFSMLLQLTEKLTVHAVHAWITLLPRTWFGLSAEPGITRCQIQICELFWNIQTVYKDGQFVSLFLNPWSPKKLLTSLCSRDRARPIASQSRGSRWLGLALWGDVVSSVFQCSLWSDTVEFFFNGVINGQRVLMPIRAGEHSTRHRVT